MLARRGAPTEEPANLLSTNAWRLAFVSPEASHGVPLALAERSRPTRRREVTPRPDCVAALDHVVINTPNPDRARAF